MSRAKQDTAIASRPARAGGRRAPLPGATAHEQLVDAASELFYTEGVRAVGVDAVVERAGVNKMSLYRQFASKDELIVAYLERMDARYWERFEESIAKHPGQPALQIKQVFIDLARRAGHPEYRGCPFVNVSCEFPDRSHPARQVVAHNKATLLSRLTGLARAAGAREPEGLAGALALLIEGVYAASQTFDKPNPLILHAPAIAAQWVDAAVVGHAVAGTDAPCA
jgi:AcrR family transcriptional regulator